MRIWVNESAQGPRFRIKDRPDDDEWIDITEMSDTAERWLGRNSGDTLEVRRYEGRAVAFRKKARP